MNEGALQHIGVTGNVNVGKAVQQLFEHHADLPARQVGAKAKVGATSTKTSMFIGRSAKVEGLWVAKLTFVAVC